MLAQLCRPCILLLHVLSVVVAKMSGSTAGAASLLPKPDVPGPDNVPPKQRHIVVVSCGRRPHLNLTRPRVETYAASVNASLEVLATDSNDFEACANLVGGIPAALRLAWTANAVGRRNSTSLMLKHLAAHRALRRGANRVLMIDDTVLIAQNAPSIFDDHEVCSPGAAVCGYPEGATNSPWNAHLHTSPTLGTNVKDRQMLLNKFGIETEETDYLNTGVVLFGQPARAILSPEAMAGSIRLAAGQWVDQGYIVGMMHKQGWLRDGMYARMPTERYNYNVCHDTDFQNSKDRDHGLQLTEAILARTDVAFFHLTSWLKGSSRQAAFEQLAAHGAPFSEMPLWHPKKEA